MGARATSSGRGTWENHHVWVPSTAFVIPDSRQPRQPQTDRICRASASRRSIPCLAPCRRAGARHAQHRRFSGFAALSAIRCRAVTRAWLQGICSGSRNAAATLGRNVLARPVDQVEEPRVVDERAFGAHEAARVSCPSSSAARDGIAARVDAPRPHMADDRWPCACRVDVS